MQFLPDVTIECPDCGGSRYASEADAIRRAVKAAKGKAAKMKVPDKRKAAKEKLSEATDQGGGNISLSLPQLMAMSVDQALSVTGTRLMCACCWVCLTDSWRVARLSWSSSMTST